MSMPVRGTLPLMVNMAGMIPVIFAESMNMNAIIEAQTPWFFILSPLGALIFLIAAIAELGRAPFDLAEGESELVSGFNIEYSGMKFGMFMAGEFLHDVSRDIDDVDIVAGAAVIAHPVEDGPARLLG